MNVFLSVIVVSCQSSVVSCCQKASNLALTTIHWPLTTDVMKPSIPKGTRDFSPQEVVKRNYIFDTIRQVFKLYGYMPIETPSMETLDTLMGKYGEEGDKLIFKIINSGNALDALNSSDIDKINEILLKDIKSGSLIADKRSAKEIEKHIEDTQKKIINKLTEKALRYDLTVPFARYVVMHQNEITFPFKRYQIQPVWRADRPQKGRYREFYQCDADVIGSDSLLNEVELIQIINDVFTKLDVPVIIKLNNRKILQGIAEVIGTPERMTDIAIAIDKLDKIGLEGVREELKSKNFSSAQIKDLERLVFAGDGSGSGRMDELNTLKNEDSAILKKGINELEYLFDSVIDESPLELDISLARGLNYYTGTIIEIKVDTDKCKSQFTSSIGGGGRYDDLTGIFGLKGMSGVGVSFGADRIYDVLEELGKFPADVTTSTQVMFVNFGENEAEHCLSLVSGLRKAGISAELFPDAAKFKKQMGYADTKKIAFVAFVGADEINKGVVKLRNMATGEEKEIPAGELSKHIL